MSIDHVPAVPDPSVSGPVVGPVPGAVAAGLETAGVDAMLAARNAGAAVRIAGLIDAAQLDTAGSPRKLPMDLFPGVDPEVVRMVWERALVVGVRAGQLMGAPRFYRDKLERLQGELAEAGFRAMGRSVGRARAAVPGHPADVEDGRGH